MIVRLRKLLASERTGTVLRAAAWIAAVVVIAEIERRDSRGNTGF